MKSIRGHAFESSNYIIMQKSIQGIICNLEHVRIATQLNCKAMWSVQSMLCAYASDNMHKGTDDTQLSH